MKLKSKQGAIILVAVLIGYLISTIYVGYFLKDPQYIDINIIGIKITMAFIQMIGILISFFVGVIIAVFTGRKGFDKVRFMERIRKETFSFIGLSFALMTFIFNVAMPHAIPSYIATQVAPQGHILPSVAESLFISVFVSILLIMLCIGFFLKVFGKEK
jgi:hypothetical protein